MRNKKTRILVFGYFGYVTNQLDGQTVKTRAIYNLLKDYSNASIRFSDTQEFRKNLFSIVRCIVNIIWCNSLVWLPAQNNLHYFFKPIWYLSKIFGFSITYIVIGGWLSKILEGLPFHRKHLGEIKGIFVENQTTIDELSTKYGYDNLAVIPNFRKQKSCLKLKNTNDQLKLVFMARVDMNKGLDTISELCKTCGTGFKIDFYGPINPSDNDFFHSLIQEHDFLEYKGVLQPTEIVKQLNNYDAMILPTHYYTEGLPGSIVDAFFAGLPVIVTNWKHAMEFITDGETGFIVDFNNPLPKLQESIEKLSSDLDLLNKMKANAFDNSQNYTCEKAWDILKRNI